MLGLLGVLLSLAPEVTWRQAKVVARDPNTGELNLRYNEKGQSISAGARPKGSSPLRVTRA